MSLYMFRALNAHLQEDTLYTCSIWYCHFLRECTLCTDRPPRTIVESDSTICCMYTVCPPEDEHLRLETCRGT
jgi:hypothetical protein